MTYNGREYPGIIQEHPADDKKGPTVNCMVVRDNLEWPNKDNFLDYE